MIPKLSKRESVIELGISDHSKLYICPKMGIAREKPKMRETRKFKKIYTREFQNDLLEAFRYFTYNSDSNTAWQEWKETSLHVADIHAPYRSTKIRNEYYP